MLKKDIIRVLLIEDSIIIRRMVRKMLKGVTSCDFEIHDCEDLTTGIARLRHDDFDIVVLDLSLPESTGVETVSKVRAIEPDIPIVVFTGSDDDTLSMAAMHLGADDYLLKKEVQQGSLLSRTLQYTIQQKKAQLALNRYAMEMERLAESRARQLIHQDRLAAIGTMSAGIAHEIRGPLSFISDNVRALSQQWEEISGLLADCQNRLSDDDISYYIKETPGIFTDIFNGIDRITDITNGLKTFSRQGNTGFSTVAIEECVENALMLCRNLLKYGIEIDRNFNTHGLRLPLQRQKIEQVFVNLFYNAAQAMENQGAISISTQIEEDLLKVVVSDTGPGIPEETLDSIWEPFFTTKPEESGTSLGLSICKEIITAHGGTIHADNWENGARFLLSLPIQPSPDDEAEVPRA
ncbi:MAG: response regulator [Deltaproteobacteria bacterium]|nr:response regulator [Deltaproteobacteria bacterium]